MVPDNRGRSLALLLMAALLVCGLYFVRELDYKYFHFSVEFFSTLIGFSIFIIGWNARRTMDSHYLLLVSISYLYVSLINILHTLSYKGMDFFPNLTTDEPTQLWIASRYLESAAFFAAPFFVRRKINAALMMTLGSLFFLLAIWSIFFSNAFPHCFVEGQGLTRFKIVSEFVIVAIFLAALGGLLLTRKHFDANILQLIISSLVLSIGSEFCFMVYASPFDLPNFIGHILRLFSYGLLYKAIIDTGIRKPYDLLYYNLTTNEKRLQTVLDILPVGVWLTDKEGRIVFGNATAREIWGLAVGAKPEEFGEFKKWWTDALESDNGAIARATRHGQSSLNEILDMKSCLGEPKTVSNSSVPLYDETGAITGVIVTTQDITELRQANQALRESEERFRGIFQQAAVGIVQASKDFSFNLANQSFLSMTGYTQQELSRMTVFELTHPDDREETRQLLDKLMNRRISEYSLEKRYIRKDGRVIWVMVNSAAVHGSDGEVKSLIVVVQDITQRRQAEEELKALTQTLEERVAERTAVAERRARRVRALAAALSDVEQEERQKLAQILHDHLQQLLVAARMTVIRAQKIPEDEERILGDATLLIDQAIHETRSLSLQLYPPILAERGFAAALNWLAEQMRQQHQLQVEVEVRDNVGEMAPHSSATLYQIIRELLFNVVKHSGVDRARVTVAPTDNGRVMAVVEDKGKGFDPASLSDERESGNSFGLFSVQRRIDLEGGSMTIESAVGKGARITAIMAADTPSANEGENNTASDTDQSHDPAR